MYQSSLAQREVAWVLSIQDRITMEWIMSMNTHFIKLFGINMLDCGFLDPQNNISANSKSYRRIFLVLTLSTNINWQLLISQSLRIFLSLGMLWLNLQELASEDFGSSVQFWQWRNTVCISLFQNWTDGAKDSPPSRRWFIQRFPSIVVFLMI